MALASDFAAPLFGEDLADIEQQGDVVYAIADDHRLVYFNPAWERFARENGGVWPSDSLSLGASVLAATPEALRGFYRELFASARRAGAPVDHDYDCSSPTVFRRLRMRVYPLAPSGWLVTNSVVVERLAPESEDSGVASDYLDAHGMITMCAHCRRTRRADVQSAERWDWVPAWVARIPERTSHGLCPGCFAYHYPSASPGG
jgi:hypothetical protein